VLRKRLASPELLAVPFPAVRHSTYGSTGPAATAGAFSEAGDHLVSGAAYAFASCHES